MPQIPHEITVEQVNKFLGGIPEPPWMYFGAAFSVDQTVQKQLWMKKTAVPQYRVESLAVDTPKAQWQVVYRGPSMEEALVAYNGLG